MQFDPRGFSTRGLLMMHEGILKAHQEDAITPAGHGKPYGVYEFSDWKAWPDELEKELDDRSVVYQKVVW